MPRQSYEYRSLCSLGHEARRALAEPDGVVQARMVIRFLCERFRGENFAVRDQREPELNTQVDEAPSTAAIHAEVTRLESAASGLLSLADKFPTADQGTRADEVAAHERRLQLSLERLREIVASAAVELRSEGGEQK